ncbi:uncharacterized protein Z519_10142 [Cladophialophora bantiana CBS 173.52]|uniref:Letm1 RBD domain-containing protein n=1 Tax=Cladophialophora bantiana (strain ATCC 10958 / CBS 173.52 / CDC B-1940 / NIH 8579) TaxID=1442370 RepID=A0A0D2HXG1_CLAB1|nr:uncharacterized protein Z519_10142 [Cladophialophora bantiana CBS 173.52]KIW89289.1 hypothetical protein Z519_10142 [Cladophialophora bantiana CBS 173.52]
MSLLSSLNHSATGSRSLRRVFCRSFSVSTSSFFSPSSTSFISTRRQPQGHSTPKSWLEQLYPAFFTETPIYPNVLRIKSLTSSGSAGPHDLSSLRPPPLPFVPPPQAKKNGRITLLQRLRYRWRRAAALNKFYKQGIAQIWGNEKECTLLRKRLAAAGVSPALAAIYGGSNLTVQGQSISIPQISRREFQLLLRHGSDFARLPGFALVFWLFRSWTPIIAARVPSTCERPSDRSRQLKALCNRYEFFAHSRNDKLENVTDNSHLTITEQGKELHTLSRRRVLRWHYVVVDEPLCKLIPWIPYAWTESAARFFDRRCRDHYRSVLADTVLIMREGGFNTLSADDIYEYCVRCASPTFINYAKQALQNGANPASEAMRKAMVPVLEARAKRMLAIDWTRLHPGLLGLIEPLSRLQDREHSDSVRGRTG